MRTLDSFVIADYVLYGALILLGVVFIFVVVTMGVSFRVQQKLHEKVLDSSNSIRVFRLDIRNDRTDYFDSTNLQSRRISSLTNFYNMFPSNERERLIEWVGHLLEKDEETPQTLEISIIIRRNKRRYFTLLEVTNVDYENQVIHLESHILRFINVSKSRRNKEGFYKFSTQTSLSASMKEKQNRGHTICIRFFQKHSNEPIPKLQFAMVKNALVPLISSSRLMIEYGIDEILVCDFKASIRSQAVQLIHLIEAEIKRHLAINSSIEDFGYSAGIIDNKLLHSDLEKIIEEGSKLTLAAREENLHYVFFEESGGFNATVDHQNYRTEVERIIYDKRLEYLYRPVYDAERSKTVGYKAIVKPQDSFFGSIEELKSYAYKTSDDKELFTTIARNCISRFIQQKSDKNQILFFDATYNEIPFIARTLSYIQGIKETRVVVVINEEDFDDLPQMSTESVISSLVNLKSRGYAPALRIRDKSELPLHPSIYEAFDYFIIDADESVTSHALRQLPIFQKLIENLLKFRKTIIAENMPSWDSVELVVRLGVSIVSSEVIGPSDQNVLPLNKKTMLKLDRILQ